MPPKKNMKLMRDAFPEALKRARTTAGLTQIDLAQKCKISVAYLSLLENGRRCPPLDTVDSLAYALGVPAFSLLKE